MLTVSSLLFAQAQVLQKSNVYLFELKPVGDTALQFSKPRYLTDFNATGYNNHPAFFGANELYMSVQTPRERQPDLYMFDLEKKTKTRVTQTAEGEFSPMMMPDGFNFSAVRQEFTGKDTLLRVWQFPLDRLNNGKPVFKYQNDIGYYLWLNSQYIATFLTSNPPVLAIGNVSNDQFIPVDTAVGRCFRLLPNGNLAYVKKGRFENWKLMERKVTGVNWDDVPAKEIAETIPGAEDFAVLPDGSFLMAKGSRVYHLNPRGKNNRWREVANLQLYDINNITRLAVSADRKLALVAD
jgi:hypothetical protein